ncbi:GDP-mannose 4,6-dehydratase [Mesorhizobium sp. M1339]
MDKRYFRPTDVVMGDASKATSKLGWESKTTFDELVSEMVEADCRAAESRSIKVKDNCFVGGNAPGLRPRRHGWGAQWGAGCPARPGKGLNGGHS